MTTQAVPYTISTSVDMSYGDAIERVTELLADEGFGVLTTIDVKATLKTKLGVDVEPYMILGACNPQLAHRGMGVEPELGALLPCNVIVYERGGMTRVAAMDPLTGLGMVGNPQLDEVANEAHARISRVIAAIGA